LPSFKPPAQCALAVRCMYALLAVKSLELYMLICSDALEQVCSAKSAYNMLCFRVTAEKAHVRTIYREGPACDLFRTL